MTLFSFLRPFLAQFDDKIAACLEINLMSACLRSALPLSLNRCHLRRFLWNLLLTRHHDSRCDCPPPWSCLDRTALSVLRQSDKVLQVRIHRDTTAHAVVVYGIVIPIYRMTTDLYTKPVVMVCLIF